MSNTYTGLFQVLAAAVHKASLAKKHRNWLVERCTNDFSPEFAAPYSIINTNVANSNFQPTNLGSGNTLNPSNVNLDPGAVTLNQHPSLAFDLPSVDVAKAGSFWIKKVTDEALKSIANNINQSVAALFTPANFNAYQGDGSTGVIEGFGDTEVNVLSGATLVNDKVILSPTLARAWETLADNQVPMRDGELSLAMAPAVYANQVQHPSWVAAYGAGPAIAEEVTRTAILNRHWGLLCDYDPDLDADKGGSSGAFYCPMFHRYAVAIVSRAIPPPAAPYEYAYTEWNGISIRMTVGFYAPTMSNRLTFDCLHGEAVVRPDHGILIMTK